jgi:hypothetical protein
MGMRYTILSAQTAEALEKSVNSYIVKGWEPYTMLFHADGKFYQPMIRDLAPKDFDIKKDFKKKD